MKLQQIIAFEWFQSRIPTRFPCLSTWLPMFHWCLTFALFLKSLRKGRHEIEQPRLIISGFLVHHLHLILVLQRLCNELIYYGFELGDLSYYKLHSRVSVLLSCWFSQSSVLPWWHYFRPDENYSVGQTNWWILKMQKSRNKKYRERVTVFRLLKAKKIQRIEISYCPELGS